MEAVHSCLTNIHNQIRGHRGTLSRFGSSQDDDGTILDPFHQHPSQQEHRKHVMEDDKKRQHSVPSCQNNVHHSRKPRNLGHQRRDRKEGREGSRKARGEEKGCEEGGQGTDGDRETRLFFSR
ncbi:hypothetical protein AMECASPLE_038209 [Ameca splendens]|uniref:Uncharacterized protein n=1 Tax=Ameca splendens TaxID=208324 RepID=A0ABV0Z606_9TELE